MIEWLLGDLLSEVLGNRKLPTLDRENLYHELANRAEEGIALGPALMGYWETQTNFGQVNSRFGRLLRAWAEDLSGLRQTDGRIPLLSDLIRPYVPPIEAAFVHLAETQEDGLVTGLRVAAAYSQQSVKLEAARRSTFRNIVPWFGMAWLITASVYGAQQMIASILDVPLAYSAWQERLMLYIRIVTFGFWPLVGIIALIRCWSLWAFPNWVSNTRVWCDRHMPGFTGYAEYHGLGTLAAVSEMLKAGRSAGEALTVVNVTATRWLASYLETLMAYCRGHRNDLIPGLQEIGGHFPTPLLVRRLAEAAKSPAFADHAAEILDREIQAAAAAALEDSKRLNDRCMVLASLATTLAIIADLFLQSAIDQTMNFN